MMTSIFEILQLRRLLQLLLLAIFHTAFWVIILALFTEHPIAEWAATIAVIFLIWIVVRDVIVYGHFAAIQQFRKRVERIRAHIGEISPEREDGEVASAGMLFLVFIYLFSALALAYGIALAAAGAVLPLFGRTPLPDELIVVGYFVGGLGFAVGLVQNFRIWRTLTRADRLISRRSSVCEAEDEPSEVHIEPSEVHVEEERRWPAVLSRIFAVLISPLLLHHAHSRNSVLQSGFSLDSLYRTVNFRISDG